MTKCSIRKEFPSTAAYLKSTCYHQAFWKIQDPCKYKVFILETQNIAHMNFRLRGCNIKPFSSPLQIKLQVWRKPAVRKNHQDAKVHSLSFLWLLLPLHPAPTAPEELLQCPRSKPTQKQCKYPFVNPSPLEPYKAEFLLCQNW